MKLKKMIKLLNKKRVQKKLGKMGKKKVCEIFEFSQLVSILSGPTEARKCLKANLSEQINFDHLKKK